MTRPELAVEINRLFKSGELVSVMQHAYTNRKSRTWAENNLIPENGWIKIESKERVYFLKDK